MAFFRGIQEYIARDVNNIARVEDEGNIVSIEAIQYYISVTVRHFVIPLVTTLKSQRVGWLVVFNVPSTARLFTVPCEGLKLDKYTVPTGI